MSSVAATSCTLLRVAFACVHQMAGHMCVLHLYMQPALVTFFESRQIERHAAVRAALHLSYHLILLQIGSGLPTAFWLAMLPSACPRAG